jgi:hypothetical protein
MVQRMALEGGSITRSNFRLISRGYGPIGAPTMSIEEALCMSCLPRGLPVMHILIVFCVFSSRLCWLIIDTGDTIVTPLYILDCDSV